MILFIASQITEGKSQRRDPDATPTLIRDVLVWLFFRSRFLLWRGAKHGNERRVERAPRELRLKLNQRVLPVIFMGAPGAQQPDRVLSVIFIL